MSHNLNVFNKRKLEQIVQLSGLPAEGIDQGIKTMTQTPELYDFRQLYGIPLPKVVLQKTLNTDK